MHNTIIVKENFINNKLIFFFTFVVSLGEFIKIEFKVITPDNSTMAKNIKKIMYQINY